MVHGLIADAERGLAGLGLQHRALVGLGHAARAAIDGVELRLRDMGQVEARGVVLQLSLGDFHFRREGRGGDQRLEPVAQFAEPLLQRFLVIEGVREEGAEGAVAFGFAL